MHSDTGFHIFMALLGVYFVGALVVSVRGLWKAEKKEHRKRRLNRKKEPERHDFKVLWSNYRAARLNASSRQDAIRFATDVVTEYQKTGVVPSTPPPNARVTIEPPERTAARIGRFSQAILINAVTAFGVFKWRWPVGTALALYWTETVLGTLLLVVLLVIWRWGREVETRGAGVGEILTTSAVFSGAHLIFLIVFLILVIPKYSATEGFDRTSYEQGLLLIGILLFIDFAFSAIAVRYNSDFDLQRRAELHLSRIGVLHLTIVFGMFALIVVGSVRALFGVFAALKALVDLSRRVS